MGTMSVKDKGAWESELLQSDILVLVKFHAEWCGHCHMIKQTVEELSEDYVGRVKFVDVDIDKSEDLASQYEVHSTPTLLIFGKGSIAAQHVGSAPKATYKNMIDGALGTLSSPSSSSS